MCLGLHLVALLFTHETDGRFHQITDDLFNIAANIAHFGKLGGLNLDERGAGKLGQTTGDFRLANAGWSDHQNVFWHDLFAHLAFQLLATPAIAQSDGHGALGVVLADDEAVKLGDDFTGRKITHDYNPVCHCLMNSNGCSSMITLSVRLSRMIISARTSKNSAKATVIFVGSFAASKKPIRAAMVSAIEFTMLSPK
ncbi:hypothetical protein FQZ97_1028640 [compost metagenome]